MLANGFMSVQTVARCYVRRPEIVAYSVRMGQSHARQYSFMVKQVALVAPTPNPALKRDAPKAARPLALLQGLPRLCN